MEKIIVVYKDKCMECHTCELVCAVAHSESKQLPEAMFEKHRAIPRIILEKMDNGSVPVHCKQCADAPCITVCPTNAMNRLASDSPVVINCDLCIGCNACILVCPFGVIQKVSGNKGLVKCDFCIERLQEDQDPACAEACPTKAIKFLLVNEITAEKRKEHLKKYMVALSDELE